MIEPFLEMMAAERGASRNTLESYGRDLSDVQKYLDKTVLIQASSEDLQGYLRHLSTLGLQASSMARIGKISAHKRAMTMTYFWALLVTGGFTLIPERTMYLVFFG